MTENTPVNVPTKPTKAYVALAFTIALAVLAAVQAAISDGQIATEEWFVIAGAVVTALAGGTAVYQTKNAPTGNSWQ